MKDICPDDRQNFGSLEKIMLPRVSDAQTFRDSNMGKFYLPTLFNSQPNEEIFRQFRSMGTISYTKINFSLLKLFHLVGRVELQNNIVHVKLAGKGVFFSTKQN